MSKNEKRRQSKINKRNLRSKKKKSMRNGIENLRNKFGDKMRVIHDVGYEEFSPNNETLSHLSGGDLVFDNTNTSKMSIEEIRQLQEQETKEWGGRINHIQTPEEIFEMNEYWNKYLNTLPPVRKSLSDKFIETDRLVREDLSSEEKIEIFESNFSPIFNEVICNRLEKIKGYKRESKKLSELNGMMYYTHEILGSDVNLYPENFVKRYPEKDGIRMNHLGTHSISYSSETEDLIIEKL